MNHRLAILGRLGVGVAHDLEHDLRVIDDALRVLEWHGLAGEPKLAHDEARDALRHATRLTGSLLAYARGETPLATRVDLSALLRRVLDRFAGTLGRGVRLVAELDDDLPPVRATAADLELLVLNALLYASDHVPADGDILVRVCRGTPREIVLELAHSGEIAETIEMDPLLGVASTIAERHGAHLQRAPRAGGGSRCTMTFPIPPER